MIFDKNAIDEIYEELNKDYVSGITLTGGDPMYYGNRTEITELCKNIKDKFPNKTIWMYTGFLFDEIKEEQCMKYIDIVVDGEYVDELRNTELFWRGSSNQRVINVKESLKKNKTVLYCD